MRSAGSTYLLFILHKFLQKSKPLFYLAACFMGSVGLEWNKVQERSSHLLQHNMRVDTVCDCMVSVYYCVFYPNRWFPHKCVLFLSPDDSNDTNLCSGRPVSGATTLKNGTIVVFRGECQPGSCYSRVFTVNISANLIMCLPR